MSYEEICNLIAENSEKLIWFDNIYNKGILTQNQKFRLREYLNSVGVTREKPYLIANPNPLKAFISKIKVENFSEDLAKSVVVFINFVELYYNTLNTERMKSLLNEPYIHLYSVHVAILGVLTNDN